MADNSNKWDVFIAYASPDKATARELYELLVHKCKVFMDFLLGPGENWAERIPLEQKVSRITVVLISHSTSGAFYVRDEIAQAIELSRNDKNKHRVVPVYLENFDRNEDSIPYGLNNLVSCTVSEFFTLDNIAIKIIDLLERIKTSSIGHPSVRIGNGIQARDFVFNNPTNLPDHKVFAAELLTSPVTLDKSEDGKIIVTINRRGVQDAVYTSEGKKWLCTNFLKQDVKNWAEDKDVELHNFLIGRTSDNNNRLVLPLHNFPLRWASGGILSVIKIRGKEDLWTPFFFRDLEPLGWNIALGSSENENELNNPNSFLMREFLEETLVLPGNPGAVNNVKTFTVAADPVNGFSRERKQAKSFIDAHINVRNQTDNLNLSIGEEQIICESERTNTVIKVLDAQVKSQSPPEWRNVLVCFNLLELGIEVVKILEYELDDSDYLLDGEILDCKDKITGERWQQLIRMPIALISHKYLERIFGKSEFSLNHVYPEIITMQENVVRTVKSPSHMLSELPKSDEIHIFSWDIEKRKLIADMDKKKLLDFHKSDRKAIKRHQNWMNNFASYFINSQGDTINNNPIPWFTPASAKIMSYYFANKR